MLFFRFFKHIPSVSINAITKLNLKIFIMNFFIIIIYDYLIQQALHIAFCFFEHTPVSFNVITELIMRNVYYKYSH